jgi:hypothetical protein
MTAIEGDEAEEPVWSPLYPSWGWAGIMSSKNLTEQDSFFWRGYHMPWDAEYVADAQLVVISGSGRLSSQDARRLVEQAALLMNGNGATRFLCDYSDAAGEATTMDIHDLPELQQKLGTPKSVKIALVLPRTGHKLGDFLFYETVCRNRGYNCRTFKSREDAVKWLEQGKPA